MSSKEAASEFQQVVAVPAKDKVVVGDVLKPPDGGRPVRGRDFQFDSCFGVDSTQEEVRARALALCCCSHPSRSRCRCSRTPRSSCSPRWTASTCASSRTARCVESIPREHAAAERARARADGCGQDVYDVRSRSGRAAGGHHSPSHQRDLPPARARPPQVRDAHSVLHARAVQGQPGGSAAPREVRARGGSTPRPSRTSQFARRHRAKPPPLSVHKDTKGIVYVENVTTEDVHSAADIFRLLDRVGLARDSPLARCGSRPAVAQGNDRRHVAETLMNATSSRSHSVASILIETTNKRSGVGALGKLTLVDLAGSRRPAALRGPTPCSRLLTWSRPCPRRKRAGGQDGRGRRNHEGEPEHQQVAVGAGRRHRRADQQREARAVPQPPGACVHARGPRRAAESLRWRAPRS